MDEVVLGRAELYRLFRAIPDSCALIATDPPRFTIIDINDRYLETSQQSRDELVGASLFDAFPLNDEAPETTDVDELRGSLERVIATKVTDTIGAVRYDIPRRKAHGGGFSERYWSPRNVPILDDAGEVAFILHRVEDVTDLVVRERVEQERRALPAIDAAGRKKVIIADEDETVRGYLERLCETQWDVHAVADGHKALEAMREIRPDVVVASMTLDGTPGEELLEAVRSEPQLADVPVILLGTHVDQPTRDRGMRLGADDFISRPLAPREVIARIQAQLFSAQLRSWLEERTRSRFYELFMEAPAFIAIMEGPEHVYTLSNPAHDRIAGGRELIGRSAHQVYPEPDVSHLLDLLDRVYETGESASREEERVLLEADNAEQRELYATFVYLPTKDLEGNIDGVVAFGWDVTEQVRTRQRIQELADQANEENRLKDEFLAMLGHELRNPLAPLATVAEILEHESDQLDAKRVGWAADVVSRQVGQLTGLVDDLLDVARISQGRIELESDIEPLQDVLTAAVETVEPLIAQRDQRFHTSTPPAVVYLEADPMRLTQIVANLLHNATKYTPEGGEIWLDARVDDQELIITVEDTGCGIDAELLPHVFDLFRQAERSLERSQGGLGLGLTLVRRLVEMHNGSVAAYSEGPGQGSRFEVRLPVVHEVESEGARQSGTDDDARNCRRVLVVDDNRDAAQALAAMLELMGNQVAVAHDGEQALREARQFAPDVVLLDIGLPGIDGYEVARRLRQRPEMGDTLLVALTGYGRDSDRQRSHEAGFNDHIVKPAGRARIEDVLERAD